jgi:adenylate cyclase
MVDISRPITEQDTERLSRLVNSLRNRLRVQREQLRQKGMDVPPGTLNGLDSIHVDLEQLGPMIVEQYNELDRLRALAETTSLITSSLDLDVVLGSVMETVLQLTGAVRGYIMLRNEATSEMEVRIAKGISQQDMESDTLVVSRTVVEQVVRDGQPVVTTNAQMDDRFAGQKSVVGYNLRSILCVPLIIKGTIEGVIYADNNIQNGLFGKKELQLLYAIAGQSALAIENAKLFEQASSALEQITDIKTLLDNILASIVSGVITTDAQNRITTYNVSAESILGVPYGQSYGQLFEKVLPMVYEHVASCLDAVRTRDEFVTMEAETDLGKASHRNLNLKVSPLKDGSNTTQGVALVVDDITERKKQDAKLAAVRRYLPPAMVDNIQSIEGIGLGGERRLITVMFVDVRPFDLFPANLQANQIMERLNTYLTVATEVIHGRAGLIDKYVGSEIMALFNTQLNPSETHAWDAVETALELTEEFDQLYRQLGEDPNTPFYRIGIHTGEATLGNVGGASRREFTALGDTVNLAKRLQENATPGQLIISRDTYMACSNALDDVTDFEVVSRDSLQVKGRTKSTQIYELRHKD